MPAGACLLGRPAARSPLTRRAARTGGTAKAPGRRRETGVAHFAAAALVGIVRQRVAESPGLFAQFIPGDDDSGLRRLRLVIDDDQMAFVAQTPAPGEDTLATLVVGPAAGCAEAPLTLAQGRPIDRASSCAWKAARSSSAGLLGRRPRKTGSRTLRFSNCPSCSSLAPGSVSVASAAARSLLGAKTAAARGSSWFSMKRSISPGTTNRPAGADERSRRHHARGGRRASCHSSNRSLALKLPLKIPVGLGDELELRLSVLDRRDQNLPVIVGRCGARACPPGPREDRVEHQHRHVAAHAVALRGDLRDGVDRCWSQPGCQGVELQHVGPGRKRTGRDRRQTPFPTLR